MRCPAFRFDEATHIYTLLATGEVLPHTTGLLMASGKRKAIPERFAGDALARGSAVHRVTARIDAGAITREELEADRFEHPSWPYWRFVDAHVRAIGMLRPVFHAIEEAIVHPRRFYGCRPDRVVELDRRGVLEIKTGDASADHSLQTALQVEAVAAIEDCDPSSLGRWCLYLDTRGGFHVEEHRNKYDLVEARRILDDHGGRVRG